MVDYAQHGYLYFLLDFCYFTNGVTLAYLWLLPTSAVAFRVAFVLANGPLAWAIVVWRNSFVFHSVDKFTSVVIHALPPLVMYCERWFLAPASASALGADALRVGWAESFGAPLAGYVLWQALYIAKTEAFDAAKLARDPSLLTSMRWITRDRRGGMYRLCKTVLCAAGLMAPAEEFDERTWRTKLTFWGAQLVYTLFSIVPCAAISRNQARKARGASSPRVSLIMRFAGRAHGDAHLFVRHGDLERRVVLHRGLLDAVQPPVRRHARLRRPRRAAAAALRARRRRGRGRRGQRCGRGREFA